MANARTPSLRIARPEDTAHFLGKHFARHNRRVLLIAALTLLGPSDTAVISTVEPVVSIAVAALVLGERLGPLQLAGGAVVLLAVGVLARTRPAPEPVPV